MFRTTADKLVRRFQQQCEASAFGKQSFTRQRSDYRDQKGAHVQQRAFNWVMHCTISPKRGLKTAGKAREERFFQLRALPSSKSDSFFSRSDKRLLFLKTISNLNLVQH